MKPWNAPARVLLCAESLERRWLLSAPGQGDDDDGGAVDLDASEIPHDILALLAAQFPGAEALEAEYRAQDGEYEVDAKLNGKVFEVTLTEDHGDATVPPA